MTAQTLRLFNNRLSWQWHPRNALRVFIALLLWLGCVGLSLSLGTFQIQPMELLQTLQGQAPSAQHQLVLWEFRFPRTLVASLTGALFALSGASLQAMTRNPLADPSLIGISQGAALAVVALTILAPGLVSDHREWAALFGGLTVAGLIRLIAGHGHSLKFILMGIGLSFFIAALTQALLTYGAVVQAMTALAWLAGSMNQAVWADVHTLAVMLGLYLVFLILLARHTRPLSLGDSVASGLGLPLKKLKALQLLGAVLAAAVATAAVGPLGFVGLVAPHLAKRLFHCGPALSVLATAFTGAVLVLLADLVGRTAFGSIHISAGLLTSLIGAPVFITLMLKTKH